MNDTNNQHAKKDGNTDADDERAREAKRAAEESHGDDNPGTHEKKPVEEEPV